MSYIDTFNNLPYSESAMAVFRDAETQIAKKLSACKATKSGSRGIQVGTIFASDSARAGQYLFAAIAPPTASAGDISEQFKRSVTAKLVEFMHAPITTHEQAYPKLKVA